MRERTKQNPWPDLARAVMLLVPMKLPGTEDHSLPAGTHAQYHVEHGILHQSLKNKSSYLSK